MTIETSVFIGGKPWVYATLGDLIIPTKSLFVVGEAGESEYSDSDANCDFLPHVFIHKKHVICRVIDCGKATDGKQYCVKNMNIDERRKLPTDMRSTIRSACCGAKCTIGEPHEYGEQYCSKCKEACAWTKAS